VVGSWTRAGLIAGLVLLIALSAARLEARTPSARDLFMRGNKALAAGRRHEALSYFFRSLALVRRPNTLLNIAQCYRLLDFPERALTYYERYLASYAGASRIPFQAEVVGHVAQLRVQRDLLAKARRDQREGAHRAAIKRLTQARKLTRWPGIDLLLAESYLSLHDNEKARLSAAAALAGYEAHLERWRVLGGGAPKHVQVRAATSRQLVERLRSTPSKVSRSDGTQPSRSKAWLVSGIVAGGLAIAAEVVALVLLTKANQLRTDDPDFDTYKSIVIGGHISAGLLAALSGTAFILHFALAPSVNRREARGVVLTASFAF
jgi:tetratricopeptide (TPR) repeat protein